MWSSIGSLRETAQRRLSTVRESAIAAAQVAQDVLATAATEEEDEARRSADYDQWPAPSEHALHSDVNNHLNPFPMPGNASSAEQWPMPADNPTAAAVDQSFIARGSTSLPPTHESVGHEQWPTPSEATSDGVQLADNDVYSAFQSNVPFRSSTSPEKAVLPPPPPPQPGDSGVTVVSPISRASRSSRYVVAGKETGAPPVTFVAPPRPSLNVVPANDLEDVDADVANVGKKADMNFNSDLALELEKLRVEAAENAAKAEHANSLAVELRKARAEAAELAAKCGQVDVLLVQLEESKAESAANALKAAKLEEMSEELEKAVSLSSSSSAETVDAKQKLKSIMSELQESNARAKLLEAEVSEVRQKMESVCAERDSLVHQRSVFSTESPDIPEAVQALAAETETKTKEISSLQRQLKASSAKISKLTSQRNAIMRQRDDAGARLSAAGEEFTAMNSKLKKEKASHMDTKAAMHNLHVARDEALKKIEELSSVASKVLEQDILLGQLEAEKLEKSNKIAQLDNQIASLTENLSASNIECSTLRDSQSELRQEVEGKHARLSLLETENAGIMKELNDGKAKIHTLQNELDSLGVSLAQERSSKEAEILEQKTNFERQVTQSTLHVKSMWAVLESVVDSEVLRMATESISVDDDLLSTLTLKVLHGIRAMSDDTNRFKELVEDYSEKIVSARREHEEVWRRVEAAEKDRASANEALVRLEKEAIVAFDRGFADASERAEIQVSNLLQQLEDAREDVTILQESLEKSETESSNLRSSLNQMSSKANNTTRELEDSEENAAYLQDEIAGLKEDLEKVTSELAENQQLASSLEQQLLILKDEKDRSQNSFKEVQLVMETHKTAEENLQIAIEQLEAEQESIIERKTMEVQKKLDDALRTLDSMKKQSEEGAAALGQLNLRDEEISELRMAIVRLSDERVELKLELEKSISRLNRPDGEEQLVDRRVVRQLLVNYFRIGAARRKDVLELMSRMLNFSETDLVTVGLKRANLSERIGSLLQPPDLDGNTLPPIGSVSDKWVSFLLSESTNEEEEPF